MFNGKEWGWEGVEKTTRNQKNKANQKCFSPGSRKVPTSAQARQAEKARRFCRVFSDSYDEVCVMCNQKPHLLSHLVEYMLNFIFQHGKSSPQFLYKAATLSSLHKERISFQHDFPKAVSSIRYEADGSFSLCKPSWMLFFASRIPVQWGAVGVSWVLNNREDGRRRNFQQDKAHRRKASVGDGPLWEKEAKKNPSPKFRFSLIAVFLVVYFTQN